MFYLTLWAVLIPLDIAALFYFRKKKWLAVGLLLLIVMLSYQYYRLRAKCSESDQLMAGEFNSPVADACIAKMPAAARGKVAVAILGPATFGFALSPHQNIVGVGDQVLLAVDADENGLYVTSDLYTQDGALLAHVERNKFSAVGPLLCERPDLNTLSVRTWYGREALYVRYLNQRAIELRGDFNYPGLDSVVIRPDVIERGNGSRLPRLDCVLMLGGSELLHLP